MRRTPSTLRLTAALSLCVAGGCTSDDLTPPADETSTGTTGDPTTGDPTTGDPTTGDPTTGDDDPCSAIDCAPPSDPCMVAVCHAGQCEEDPAPAGTPLADPIAGDCKRVVCDGAGGVEEIDDDDDTPNDEGPCLAGTCVAGAPVQEPRTGEACGRSDALVCDERGACVGCSVAADCGSDECLAYTCEPDQTCAAAPVSAGSGCEAGLCDGEGVCDPASECYVDENCGDGLCTEANLCVECFVDEDCGGDLCLESTCAPFAVVSVVPTDEQTEVDPLADLTVQFNAELLTSTVITHEILDGNCTGTLRLSSDGFAACLPAISLASGDTVTLTPAPALSYATAYGISITDVLSESGAALATPFESTFTTRLSGGAIGGYVVVSQVYGGGGNANAPFTHDFIELHNRGAEAVNLDGWSVQYASSGGTSWSVAASLSGTVAPGGYYLVQLAGGAVGEALPTPDATGTTNLAAAAGKVALVRSPTALAAGACPLSPSVIDFVGYGNAASCAEGSTDGSTSTANASNTSAAARNAGGCTDTNNNAADFTIGAPTPRNSGTDALVCFDDAVRNQAGVPEEVDSCRVYPPAPVPYEFVMGKSFLIFGKLAELGLTPGNNPHILAQVGVGPTSANPQTQPEQWTWATAAYNAVCSSCEDDESQYFTSVFPPAPGAFMVAARFSLDGGLSWTYCDGDSSGSDPGLSFDVLALPRIHVDPA